MVLQIWVWVLELMLKQTDDDNDYVSNAVRYESSTKKVTIDTLRLTGNEIGILATILEKHYTDNVPDKNDKPTHNKFYPYLNTARKLRSVIDIANSDGTLTVKQLQQFPLIMKTFFKQIPHKILFKKSTDGFMLPYLVTDIRFDGGDRNNKIVKGLMTVQSLKRGSSESHTSYFYNRGKTAAQYIKEAGYIIETPELIEQYNKEIEAYWQIRHLLGAQYNFNNLASIGGHWVHATVDGKPTKTVIDDDSDDKEADNATEIKKQRYDARFWKDQDIEPLDIFAAVAQDDFEDQDEEDADPVIYTALPIHPYIKGFDLMKHRFITCHINNITEYEWNPNLADKLILDKETKDLIEILVDSTTAKSEDIIAGKMSGTIVIATGSPGVGKTLTAEVFSEKIQKSLYVVQCSQLGISVDTIEKNLKEVLDRASRWGSILLVDEADVYIRDRGNDIVHNAIVGVFLRLIEYYQGVLFMTSNRGDIIDDAVISRATAWIKYKLPQPDLLIQIWEVLSKQYKVYLTDDVIRKLATDIPKISGRTVRNLLKLVKALDYDNTEDEKSSAENYARLMKASQFQKLDQGDE